MFLALSWIYLFGGVFWLLPEFPVTGGPVTVATGDLFIEISVVYLQSYPQIPHS